MKIPKTTDEIEIINQIEAEGTISIQGVWVPIDTVVYVYKETEKAFYGDVIVFECDDYGRADELFSERNTWIPKSMSDNPWWICTKMFDHSGKVSNRRFD